MIKKDARFTALMALMLGIMFFAASANAGPGGEVDSGAIMALDQQSKKVLNIGLNSLRWLLDASPDSYLLQASLIEKDQLGAIEALKKNGYAKLEIVDQVPGGTRGVFLRIIPTEKGQRVIDLLTAGGR